MNQKQLEQLPTWPQRQDSVFDQMAGLKIIANRLGLYDAADAIVQLVPRLPELKYGCYVDGDDDVDPTCVIDTYRYDDCIFANPGMRKEQCPYWRIIK